MNAPPEVEAVARQFQLGTLGRVFEANKRWRPIIGLGSLALIFGAMAGVTLVSAAPPGVAIGMGVVALAALAGTVLVALGSPMFSAAARGYRFYVFAEGYIRVTKAGPVARRWDQITAVYQSVKEIFVNGISTGTTYTYQLQFTDGTQTKLTMHSTDLKTFGPLLMGEVERVQVPMAMAALRAGQPVAFGAFVLAPAGMSIKGKPPVPWPDIKGIDIARGYVRIARAGKFMATTIAAEKVPNLYTFLTIAGQLATTPAGRPLG